MYAGVAHDQTARRPEQLRGKLLGRDGVGWGFSHWRVRWAVRLGRWCKWVDALTMESEDGPVLSLVWSSGAVCSRERVEMGDPGKVR